MKNVSNASNRLNSNKNKHNRKKIKNPQLKSGKYDVDNPGTTYKSKNRLKKMKRRDVSKVTAGIGEVGKNETRNNKYPNKVKNIRQLPEGDINAVFKQKKKFKKQKRLIEGNNSLPKINEDTVDNISKIQNRKTKLISLLKFSPTTTNKKKKDMSLKERMMDRLKASRFRYINEQIYNSESKEVQTLFRNDPDAFHAYHEGYQQQISKWPLNPLDNIIKSIKRMQVIRL